MHLKLKTMSTLGSFFISSSVNTRESPFFLITYNFHVEGSKSLPMPISPLCLTVFAACDAGYDFARWFLENILLNTTSFPFKTLLNGCWIPPRMPPSNGCRRIHFQVQMHAPKKTKRKKKEVIVFFTAYSSPVNLLLLLKMFTIKFDMP